MKKNVYYKPYLQKTETYFPYPRELLLGRAIFPAYVVDTGAFLCANDLFGTVNGDEICDMTVSGALFSHWRADDGSMDWYTVWKRFNELDCTPEWEGHIWPHRLYFLLPLAHRYGQTRDRKYAALWYQLLEDWIEKNPYTTYPERPAVGAWFDMVWYEMQVAWRTINLVHSIYLLEDQDALEEDQWKRVYELISLQAEHLYKEGTTYGARGNRLANHQLQVGMALVMVGCLLPELGQADAYVELGRQIVENNLRYTMSSDGVNRENSLSYAHFIARMYVEAQLLLVGNGKEGVAGCDESLNKQYEYLYQFSASDGRSLPIGDAYVLDAQGDIDLVSQIYPLSFPREKGSRIFPNGQMAVLRNAHFELFVDAAPVDPDTLNLPEQQRTWGGGYGYHQHFGRPNFLLFADGQQLVLDPGTVNYDRAGLRCQLNRATAHNVIYCPDIPLEDDLTRRDVSVIPKIRSFRQEEGVQTLVVSSAVQDKNGRGYVWERTFCMEASRLLITDKITASEPMHFVSTLQLPYAITGYVDYWASRQPLSKDKRVIHLRREGKLQTVEMDSPAEVSFSPCHDRYNRMDCCETVTRTWYAQSFTEKTVFTFG